MCFAFFGDIFAVPALPRLLKITQPNGAEFKAYLRGDEYYSWWESENGTLLFRNMESGYFEYAKISLIESKEQLVSTGVIYVAGEEKSIAVIVRSKKSGTFKQYRYLENGERVIIKGPEQVAYSLS